MRRTLLLAALTCPLFAQDAANEQPPKKPERRYSIGGRFEYLPNSLFDTGTATSSTTKPIADYSYTGSTHAAALGARASFEYKITRHLSAGLEIGARKAKYEEVTTIRSGTKDPNSSTDNRPVTTLTQTTRSTYVEIPVLARYYGLFAGGVLSHAYAVGGMAYRHVGNVRTGNDTVNADGSTDYNEIPATPVRTNQVGFAGGFGFRFIDELGVRVSPELRYTHWQGDTFAGPLYHSNPNQFEFSLGFSF